MAEQDKCVNCGSSHPSSVRGGLCPACLLKRGLETNSVGYTDDPQAEAAKRWSPPTVEQLAPLFPELEILELIGRGGMGAVYKAREKQLDRWVALKILPPEIGREEAFAQRFTREAQAMAKLSHPSIVAMHTFGQRSSGDLTGEGDLYFFIMEYVDGLSLRQLLDAGTVDPTEAMAIVPQICDALQYAHDRGIVHRDIKPENILLNRDGKVKIADFGLAKLVGRKAAAPVTGEPVGRLGDMDITQVGDKVMGTPQYMAPEQTARPGEVDHRADIYSLGVVFYQMLTGELPAGRSGRPFEPPSRKVVIDVRLDEVVLRALEKEPDRRYQQVSEVRTQVETIVGSPAAEPDPKRKKSVADVKFNLEWGNWRKKGRKQVPLVGVRDDERIVHWPGLVLFFLIAVTSITAGAFVFDLLLHRFTGVSILDWRILLAIPLAAAATLASSVWRGLHTPIDQLTRLDSTPSARPAKDADRVERARQTVKAPAIGMIVAAGISLAVLFSCLTFVIVRPETAALPSRIRATGLSQFQALALATVGGVTMNLTILFGALGMLLLRHRRLAMTAAVLALIGSPGNIVGLPMGVWTLAVLRRREIAETFQTTTKDKTMGKSRILIGLFLAVIILTPVSLWAVSKVVDASKSGPADQQVNKAVRKAVTGVSVMRETDPRLPALLDSLRRLPEEETVDQLSTYLDSDTDTIRRAAIFILWKGGFADITQAERALLKLTLHPEEFTRGMAALALGQAKVSGAYDNIADMAADDKSPYARRAAVYALGLMGDPRARALLEKALDDPNSGVRYNAKVTLPLLDASSAVSRPVVPQTTTDQVVVEDLALAMLVAIREKDDAALKAMSVDRIKGWQAAWTHFSQELRERFTQMTGKPFTMYPASSIVMGDVAAVQCTNPKELKGGVYLALFFVKTDSGWKNFSIRNSPPSISLEDHLRKAAEAIDIQLPVIPLAGRTAGPHVVTSTPAALANDVDPSLDKITVTFDRPMTDKSWSFTSGDRAFYQKTGSQFPQRDGAIAYDAARTTCTMPVKLQPGAVYWLGVNGPRHRNFKSADDAPARQYQILFATRTADGKPTPLPEALVKAAREVNATTVLTTPEEVAAAFIAAMRANDVKRILTLAGPDFASDRQELPQLAKGMDFTLADKTGARIGETEAWVAYYPVLVKETAKPFYLVLKLVRFKDGHWRLDDASFLKKDKNVQRILTEPATRPAQN